MDRYRQDNGSYCVDITVKEFRQLYDSRDPSPFHDRDLDEALVHYVVMSCEEIGEDTNIKIVITGYNKNDQQQQSDFQVAFHQFFEHEVRAVHNELKFLFRQGRVSLTLGIGFLMICVFLAFRVGDLDVFGRVVHEGLIIMGWVALWKPLNIFLYEWWPYRRKMNVYKRLSEIEIEFKESIE